MRWSANNLTEEKIGNYRVVRKFLWFPRNFHSDQYRWLEFVHIYQRVEWVYNAFTNSKLKWVDVSFVEPDQINKSKTVYEIDRRIDCSKR